MKSQGHLEYWTDNPIKLFLTCYLFFRSFLVSHQDGSSHVHHFPHARLEEGEMVRGIHKATPESITVKMELLEPVQQIDECVV